MTSPDPTPATPGQPDGGYRDRAFRAAAAIPACFHDDPNELANVVADAVLAVRDAELAQVTSQRDYAQQKLGELVDDVHAEGFEKWCDEQENPGYRKRAADAAMAAWTSHAVLCEHGQLVPVGSLVDAVLAVRDEQRETEQLVLREQVRKQ